jgi:hypothetical protein
MKTETVQLKLDREAILAADPWTAIEPVWWTGNIYDGVEAYNRSLSQFSRPQRHVFAIMWYRSEVDNGGHDQFFSNSTGIVWQDALNGFRSMNADDFAAVLESAASRFPDMPSFDRETRQQQMAGLTNDFAEEDDRFYDLDNGAMIDELLTAYIRQNADAFTFDGMIERAVFPKTLEQIKGEQSGEPEPPTAPDLKS